MPLGVDMKALSNDNPYIMVGIEKSLKLRKKLNNLDSQNDNERWFEKIAGYLLDASRIASNPKRAVAS